LTRLYRYLLSEEGSFFDVGGGVAVAAEPGAVVERAGTALRLLRFPGKSFFFTATNRRKKELALVPFLSHGYV
jgi:hypothetical protein